MKGFKPFIVAVDGPAGSGKSSICKETSKQLGWDYLNTGAIYRTLALLAQNKGIAVTEEVQLSALCSDFEKHLVWNPHTDEMFYRGEPLDAQKLLSPSIGADASAIAKLEKVRNLRLPVQQKIAMSSKMGVIVDGRDIGTVIFPQAPLKVFMTASLDTRAARRLKQLREASNSVSFEQLPSLEVLKTEIAKRDFQDQTRGFAPLKAAEDAKILDTSERNFEECVKYLLRLVKETQANLEYLD